MIPRKEWYYLTGFLIAILSGALMAVQGVFNTQVTKATHIWVSGIWVQGTALLAAVAMWFVSGRPSLGTLCEVEHKYVLLGGVIGAFITFTVIKSISGLGTAKANLFIIVTQLAVAYLIELFGLFGSEREEFSMTKLLGILLAACGVAIFSLSKGAKA